MSQTFAPWTDEQVQNLREFQIFQPMHPFTCGCESEILLVPTNAGWVCPKCGQAQDWAWDFMINGNALANHREMLKQVKWTETIHCSESFPWDGTKEDNQRISHPCAREIADHGETVTYECPHCKHRWTLELPE